MSNLPPDKTSEFTASDLLSADAWNGRTSKPVLGLDVACTKIAVDFQNMRRPGVEETIRRNLELLREATNSDCAFAAVFGAEEPTIEDIQVARSAFAQCRPEALRGESIERFPWLRNRSEHLRLSELRDTTAHKPIVNAAISMALGCSITGPVDPDEVIRLVEKCLEAGVDFVAIADTVGYAGPKQVGELTRAAVKLSGAKPVCVHLHDTRGMGIANASAAIDAGARILDGSLGGLGGCPFAPGATGNVVFEDLAFLCESKGFASGIDIEKLIGVRAILRSEMPGETLYGGLARAGLPAGRTSVAA